LVLALSVQDVRQRLQASANASLRGDHMHELPLKVDVSVLQAQAVDLLRFVGCQSDLHEIVIIGAIFVDLISYHVD